MYTFRLSSSSPFAAAAANLFLPFLEDFFGKEETVYLRCAHRRVL